jgi:hypothetical protein
MAAGECSAVVAQQVAHINAVYESRYVGKSMVVSMDPSTMYHLHRMLHDLDYPVEMMTIHNAASVLEALCAHQIRMVIVHPASFQHIATIMDSILSIIDVIFVDGRLSPPDNNNNNNINNAFLNGILDQVDSWSKVVVI